jgi:LacI family transcriptional regulator
VSPQTVSRVINDRPDVADETRRRVKEVIERLDYQPSALARSLIQQHSYTLGVVTAGLKYIGPSRTLNGIVDRAEAEGYTLLLKELPRFNSNDIKPLLDSLLAHQVDGIVWAVPEVSENRQWLTDRLPALPVPIIFLTMQPNPAYSVVSVDNQLGGRLAVEHLLAQGCRRIGHISGPLDWWEARQRMEGWRTALQSAGLLSHSLDPAGQLWTEGNWSSASGERAFTALLEKSTHLDAVFVANDQMALGVMLAAHRQGLRIPHDLAVIGFDNLPEAAYFWPPLSSVDQDHHQLGRAAVAELVRQIDIQRSGTAPEPASIVIRPVLVVRDSSSQIKKGVLNER